MLFLSRLGCSFVQSPVSLLNKVSNGLQFAWKEGAFRGFRSGSAVKNPPAMQKTRETQVRSLLERSLEEGMAALSSFLAWRIPWMEEPGGLQSMGSQ